MNHMEQAVTFMNMLFNPGDIFEVRTKSTQQKGALQAWMPTTRIGEFAKSHLPIHQSHMRNVWVGVGPRMEANSTVPKCNRVLWVDLDSSVETETQMLTALEQSGLPIPTMTVWSGNGYHLYWKLNESLKPDMARSYAKAVHSSLPSDATHDPTRVMRVPGSYNFKDPEYPKLCWISSHHDDLTYDLELFPKESTQILEYAEDSPLEPIMLEQGDFELFVANWLEGQRNNMAMAVSGYLRKNLLYSEQDAVNEIGRIHIAAGYSWPDFEIINTVKHTYKVMFGKLAGHSALARLGIFPSVKDSFEFKIQMPKKPKISIIDFSRHIKQQEFYASGLVGPGLLTIWAAQPKSGKSFAAMQLGYALSRGEDIWGLKVPKPVKVLYFQGELSAGMVADRAYTLFGENGVQDPTQFALTNKPDESFSLIERPDILNDLAEPYDVVIVDPLSIFNSNDENSFPAVRETISIFDSLKSKGKAVILVHHTRKLNTDSKGNVTPPSVNDIRGSSAWFGAVDAVAMQWTTPDGNSRVKFTFRAAPERPDLLLYKLPTGGFTDNKGLYLTLNPGIKVNLEGLE